MDLSEGHDLPLPQFSGFTLNEVLHLVNNPFGRRCPVKMVDSLPDELVEASPLYLITRDLLWRTENEDGLKVTAKGNLQLKVVHDLYERGYLKEDYLDNGIVNIRSEEDWRALHSLKVVLKQGGVLRQYRSRLRLTKQGTALIHDADPFRLFHTVLKTFATQFNWAYNDGYRQSNAGQLGFLYLLYLIWRYGDQWRSLGFYTRRYYRAFPGMRSEPIDYGSFVNDPSEAVIGTRAFRRFARWFGLVELRMNDPERSWEIVSVKRTSLLRELLVVKRNDSNSPG